MSPDPAAVAAKALLRAQARAARRAFVLAHPEADWLAGDLGPTMLADLFGEDPGTLALYRASGPELDPRPLADLALELGWRLALPYCEHLDAPVVFRRWRPGDKLAPDACGIGAPLAAAPEAHPDIIIAPLVAFDRRGGRLGQGGGYYDRTLNDLRAKPNPPPFVGLAFSVQEVDQVPLEAHDQRLDAILTEKEYIRFP